MRSIFLYGDVGDNFCENIKPFLNSCNPNGDIALLMMNKESKKYEELYGIPITKNGRTYKAIYPIQGEVCREDLENIYNASGILMAGGFPKVYSDIYTLGTTGELIRKKYYSDIPYAGVSAGAILAGDEYEETAKTVSLGNNQVYLASKFNPKVSDEVRQDEKVSGFGFLKNILLEPHFSEWGLFPALINKLKTDENVATGVGFDETIGIRITDEKIFDFFGRGRGYVLSKKDNDFLLSIKEPRQRYIHKNIQIKEVFEGR